MWEPCLILTFLSLRNNLRVIAMRRLLPDRKVPESAFESTSDYSVELQVLSIVYPLTPLQ